MHQISATQFMYTVSSLKKKKQPYRWIVLSKEENWDLEISSNFFNLSK